LVHIAEQAGYDFSFLKGAIATNDEQFERVVGKVRAAAGGSLEGAVIAVWGLTFKAGTDDLRNSPAVEVVDRLVGEGAIVQAFDPTVEVPVGEQSAPVEGLDGLVSSGGEAALTRMVRAFPDAYAASRGAVVTVVLTEWDEFRWLDFTKVRDAMAEPVVVDARNLLDPAQLRRIGFEYTGIGRR
jgi:UDPglucose 6-dehydrogenase